MKIRVLLVALILALPFVVKAEVLLLDSVDQVTATERSRPARGMSMRSVESEFGAPNQRRSAVGEPPISRWEYPGFVVFFEHQYVIHAVVRR